MDEGLRDRIAIVIGGARGIGAGVVDVLLGRGAKVMLADLEPPAQSTAATFVTADISRREDMARLAATTLEHHGRIDALIQVAGIYPVSRLDDMAEAEWDRVLAVNLKGAFLAMQACFPAMRRQKRGRVVLTGSITGPHVTWPEHAHYSASKAGLVGLARAAALEGAADGITVNVVEPGNVLTDNLMRERGQRHVDIMSAAIPLGRLATPEEVGEAIAFLASDRAGYITGTTLVVDGGQILPEAKL